MNRRSFAQSVGSAAMLSTLANDAAQAQSSAQKTRIYRLEYLYYRQGSQGSRINEFLSSQMPLFAKNTRAMGVFTSILGPHNPLTIVLSGFASLEDMEAADQRIGRTPEFRAAVEKMESGAEPPCDRADRVLLRATDFSPEIVPLAEKPKTPRVFELRIYHSPTQRQLQFLHERFAGPEIGIFHRSGIFPILYADTLIGPNVPNQAYLMPFENLAAREKAWDAFGADPEWIKARDESIAHGGQIVADNNITLLRPTAYSPIQ
ncbi:MAG TPA: NIPSNAP family protein [Bryobacteraceae bacterium]|nr:NIPSNAP family protein [Bryobacteraceae bacterium]